MPPPRASAVPDGRVACPFCAAPIHPIAGRCRHCRADLTQARGVAVGPSVSLPALAHGAPPVATPRPVAVADAALAFGFAPPPPSVSLGPLALTSGPAVGPGGLAPLGGGVSTFAPTPSVTAPGLLDAKADADDDAPRRWWRQWEFVVILLATAAVIVAIVVMVWPAKKTVVGERKLAPPAPDTMPTDPAPPTPNIAPGAAPTAPAPDPWNDGDATPPPDDPFAGGTGQINPAPTPGSGSGAGPTLTLDNFSASLGGVLCQRLTDCLAPVSSDLSMVSAMCQMVAARTQGGDTQGCDFDPVAAQRCLDAVSSFSCSSSRRSVIEILTLVEKLPSCGEAVRCQGASALSDWFGGGGAAPDDPDDDAPGGVVGGSVNP